MSLWKNILPFIFSVLLLNSCSQETKIPTHFSEVKIKPNSYKYLIDRMDFEMRNFGLSRYGAAPGLRELRKRDVLYFEYRFRESDKWAFLTGTDIVEAGTIEIRVYSNVLTDRKDQIIARLGVILSEFGSKLIEKTQ